MSLGDGRNGCAPPLMGSSCCGSCHLYGVVTTQKWVFLPTPRFVSIISQCVGMWCCQHTELVATVVLGLLVQLDGARRHPKPPKQPAPAMCDRSVTCGVEFGRTFLLPRHSKLSSSAPKHAYICSVHVLGCAVPLTSSMGECMLGQSGQHQVHTFVHSTPLQNAAQSRTETMSAWPTCKKRSCATFLTTQGAPAGLLHSRGRAAAAGR